MSRIRLVTALLAAVAGTAMLLAWFNNFWPGSKWTVVPRAQLEEQGRQVAAHFGLDVRTWDTYVVTSLSNSLAIYGHGISPLSVRITYSEPKGGRSAEVDFDSSGTWTKWRAPDEFNGGQKFDSGEAAANEAFHFMAGTSAASYEEPTKSDDEDDSKKRDYEFKKSMPANSELRERIKAVVKDSKIERVERRVYLASSDDDDDYGQSYWAIMDALFGLICTAGTVVIVGIFVLWLVRKALNRRFQVRVAVVAFVVTTLAFYAGPSWERVQSISDSVNGAGFLGPLTTALMILGFVAVGRGISTKARPKWISMEELVLLAPISKGTGESLAAGLLFAPLLLAIPFLISGSGFFPNSWVVPQNVDSFYARSPFLASLNVGACLYVLGFFGFGVPATERLLRFRWLSWLAVPLVGVVFFADQTRLITRPLAAPLTAGFLTLSVLWYVWAQFDMLAVITLQLAGSILLVTLMRMQKHESAGTLIAPLAVLAAGALLCYWFGQPVAEGDPTAVNPMLTGFRAEREKLLAEFSVARRAQQDMLPQCPPQIPGFTVAASCTPSLEVGGDLYDFLKLRDGRIGIGVADVSGKGVPAALYMTLTKGLLSSVTKNTSDLGPVVEEVNRHLHEVTRKKVFVTMALGFLDPDKRMLQCVRAGHNPVVWRQKNQNLTTLVSPGGLGLGITASKVFGKQLRVQEMQLSDGDAVVFYSDGITEAMNRSLEQFGEQRLMEAVDRTDAMNAAAAHDSILGEVRSFLDGVHPQDDMTLVVLRVGEHK